MTKLAVDVRQAETHDVAEISEVHRASWSHAYVGLIPRRALGVMVERRGHDWWRRAIRNAPSVLVIEVAGKIAGYATLGPNRTSALREEGEIYELYLRPEYQGIGFGSRLFGEARRLLASFACRGTVVWTLEDNRPAMDFYVGRGGIAAARGVETFDGVRLGKIAFVWP